MALHWHFRGKGELIEGPAERLWTEIDLTVDSSAPWADQLRGLLTVLRAHPAATQLLAGSDKLHIGAARDCIEVTLEILRTAGFGAVDATMIARSAPRTGLTLVMSEPGIESIDAAERAELQRKKQVTLATLSPAKYPRLVECAIPMTAYDDPELHYQFGVETFMAGVAALAAAKSAQPAS